MDKRKLFERQIKSKQEFDNALKSSDQKLFNKVLAKRVLEAANCCDPKYTCIKCPYNYTLNCFPVFIKDLRYLINLGYNFKNIKKED